LLQALEEFKARHPSANSAVAAAAAAVDADSSTSSTAAAAAATAAQTAADRARSEELEMQVKNLGLQLQRAAESMKQKDSLIQVHTAAAKATTIYSQVHGYLSRIVVLATSSGISSTAPIASYISGTSSACSGARLAVEVLNAASQWCRQSCS
jgi:Tfp pilus assembly protein FimV